MGLRRTGQLTVNNLDGAVIHLNVVFDFSIAVCFGINGNGSCIAVGKLHAFSGRNNALRIARIIFDGKTLVDVGIEIGHRSSDVLSRSCIEFGCAITCRIRLITAFEHVIRRQGYERTLIICRIIADSRTTAQCIGDRFGNITRPYMKRVKLAAVYRIGGSWGNRARRNVLELTLITCRTERNLRAGSDMFCSRKTSVSDTINCCFSHSRCIGTRMRTCTDCDGFILTGGCAYTKRCCTYARCRCTRTKGSGQYTLSKCRYTNSDGGISGSRTFEWIFISLTLLLHGHTGQLFEYLMYLFISCCCNLFGTYDIPIVATDGNG